MAHTIRSLGRFTKSTPNVNEMICSKYQSRCQSGIARAVPSSGQSVKRGERYRSKHFSFVPPRMVPEEDYLQYAEQERPSKYLRPDLYCGEYNNVVSARIPEQKLPFSEEESTKRAYSRAEARRVMQLLYNSKPLSPREVTPDPNVGQPLPNEAMADWESEQWDQFRKSSEPVSPSRPAAPPMPKVTNIMDYVWMDSPNTPVMDVGKESCSWFGFLRWPESPKQGTVRSASEPKERKSCYRRRSTFSEKILQNSDGAHKHTLLRWSSVLIISLIFECSFSGVLTGG